MDAGGRKTDAAVLFQVGRTTIYDWLKRPTLKPTFNTQNNCPTCTQKN
ncbi:MAG: hypothetical protein HQL69_20115 [Magnetococcales bacterium]|nr:hypothetical protein [Magnetococcales bacterium]